MDESEIINKLKTQGYKITPVRSMLVEIFTKNPTPLTVIDILENLSKKDLTPNKTTIYREIEFLQKLEIIEEVEFGDGKKRYELLNDHHHHIICINCKKVIDIPMEEDLDSFINKIASKVGFKSVGHSLEFFGLCKDCI